MLLWLIVTSRPNGPSSLLYSQRLRSKSLFRFTSHALSLTRDPPIILSIVNLYTIALNRRVPLYLPQSNAQPLRRVKPSSPGLTIHTIIHRSPGSLALVEVEPLPRLVPPHSLGSSFGGVPGGHPAVSSSGKPSYDPAIFSRNPPSSVGLSTSHGGAFATP